MLSERGGFQLVQILGILGMYFDAVVGEVKTFFTFIQTAQGRSEVAFAISGTNLVKNTLQIHVAN